jgi:hypothetical protein
MGAINDAINTVEKLRQVAKKVEQAEMRNLLADLSLQLADVKIENAGLKERTLALREEIDGLKKALASAKEPSSTEKPALLWGCYRFGGDNSLYCVKCYETRRKKHVTTRDGSKHRVCAVCSNRVPSA